VIYAKATYNPGMHPFAPQPVVRFDGDAKLGDAGVAYEFNVKIRRLNSAAVETDWSDEAELARQELRSELHAKWPWLGDPYFTGRSGGWLAITDPSGRMTRRTLEAMRRSVGKALAAFKKYMREIYSR
jgi:hypothetical protein